jgi:hypothetical protein
MGSHLPVVSHGHSGAETLALLGLTRSCAKWSLANGRDERKDVS